MPLDSHDVGKAGGVSKLVAKNIGETWQDLEIWDDTSHWSN